MGFSPPRFQSRLSSGSFPSARAISRMCAAAVPQPRVVLVQHAQARRVDEAHVGEVDQQANAALVRALRQRALHQRRRRQVELAAHPEEEGPVG